MLFVLFDGIMFNFVFFSQLLMLVMSRYLINSYRFSADL